MDIKFEGKRALVTGAGKGIGRDIAKALVKCGAKTVALSRTEADLASLKAECPEIDTCCIDLSDWAKARSTIESLGHFDLLVNNAGVSRVGPFLDVKEEDIDFVFGTNYKSLFNVSQTVAKSMVARKSGGAIVNLSSAASKQALQDHAVYCSTKGAVDSLTSVMALELGPHKLPIINKNQVPCFITLATMSLHNSWSFVTVSLVGPVSG
ncbi:L-xylulose reductase [Elysia marginata]|uniref:L-xylulose reductase n=1 Tax=Elysia marginata TaxID=1093978 RepID=A0AAV4FFK8_9GAST|nr:L-xylulose reductase [Elysia marginata]